MAANDVKVRLTGSRRELDAFLHRHPLESYGAQDREGTLELVVYVEQHVADEARKAGLTVAIESDETKHMRSLEVGRGNRFAAGAIPLGLGLRESGAPR